MHKRGFILQNFKRAIKASLYPLYERRLVLVRPDGHVAWRGDEVPSDALALIDTVRGVS